MLHLKSSRKVTKSDASPFRLIIGMSRSTVISVYLSGTWCRVLIVQWQTLHQRSGSFRRSGFRTSLRRYKMWKCLTVQKRIWQVNFPNFLLTNWAIPISTTWLALIPAEFSHAHKIVAMHLKHHIRKELQAGPWSVNDILFSFFCFTHKLPP